MKVLYKFLLLFLCPVSLFSQVRENSGWFMLVNSTKLSSKWALHLDVQARSANEWDYLRSTIVRPGITYQLTKKSSFTSGYAWVQTFANPEISTAKNLTEHRIWEQYLLTYKIKHVGIAHRFRLEQRFIERPIDKVFSQRIRYFVRAVIPLKADSVFKKGPFIALQNEVFLTIQHKQKLNNSVFDQNRLYLAAGHRLSKKADVEVGYLNQYIKGLANNTNNHVVQLALYTRF